MMRVSRQIAGVLGAAFLAAAVLVGCEEGPAERAGSKIDKAMDKLTGKGPAEKVGERIDQAAKELTKK
jgi:hypothetical protein